MRRYPEKRAVVAAGIKSADVKIPVVIREDQHVRLGQLTLTVAKSADQLFIRSQVRFVVVENRMAVKLLVQADHRIRIFTFVSSVEPFDLRVPFSEPRRSLIGWNGDIRVFEDLERKSFGDLFYLERKFPICILLQA